MRHVRCVEEDFEIASAQRHIHVINAKSKCGHPLLHQTRLILCHPKFSRNIMTRAINDLIASWIDAYS